MTARTKAIRNSGFFWIGMLVLLALLSPLDSSILSWITIGFLSVWVLYTLLLICLVVFENREMKKILTEETDRKEKIDLLLEKRERYWIPAIVNAIDADISILYLLNGEVENAKNFLDGKNSQLTDRNFLYPLFLIAIYENDLNSAQEHCKRLSKIKNKHYADQKAMAEKILTMILTGNYDPTIYETTHYDFVKEICLKYRDGTELENE